MRVFILASALAFVVGCSSSSSDDTSSAPDAGGDATSGADVNDFGDDSVDTSVAPLEAGPDVTTNPSLPSILLTAVAAGTMPPAITTVFQSGAWSPLTTIGGNEYGAGGGGVTALANSQGLAVVRSRAGAPVESVWNGTWPTLYQIDMTDDQLVSGPVAAAPGAFVAEQSSVGTYPITLDTFDESGPTWSTGEVTGAVGDSRGIPVVAVTAAGNPLILYSSTPTAVTTYRWVARTGTTWSTAADVPAIGTLSVAGVMPMNAALPATAAVTRVGTDDVVAVFLTGGPTAFTLQSSTYSAGAWSASPLAVATDVITAGFGVPFSLTALPDGRVALAYATTTNGINVGFFDGTTWGAFAPIPTAIPIPSGTYAPIAITGGIGGDVVEVVYIDQNYYLRHARMTGMAADAGATWTTPVPVDSSQPYGFVAIATSP
jgi:hypothetical protein